MEIEDEDFFLRGDVARDLDFYRIREVIAGKCVSEEGQTALLKRESCSDAQKLDVLKKMGREWGVFLHSSYPQCLSGWPAVADLFPLLGVEGSQLQQDQIFALGLFCRSVKKVCEGLSNASGDLELPSLSECVSNIPSVEKPDSLIFSVIDESGQVRDLPSLRAIRNRISSLQKEIDSVLRRYTSDSSFTDSLQSTVPAYRQDRELLAVRADHRGDIKGIVHELSASGQTVYIEPDEIVRANNDLVQAEFELQAELRKIFLELTSSLGEFRDDLKLAYHAMIELDTTYASAMWQKEVNGIFAETCDLQKEPPVIIQARHPLLGKKAVPVDIRFMDGKRVLIITGPNTGGKTVTLKTIALFALLNQAGFPIPAAEGTRLPLFSSVFADIGDEQSIDESLSTFSSHMKKMALMLNNADCNSLVLLDELGSGTDPLEGGAIAMAVLDTLIERGAFVIVTTHHGILKNYGYTNLRCVNASVEFDSRTLGPTYHLLMGVPGESHAIDIAERSGLPENVVNQARSYIASEQADVSALIKGLNQKHMELDRLHKEAQSKERQIEEKSIRLHQREIRIMEQDAEQKKWEHSKSSEFLSETRSKLENLVREIREGEITREKTQSVKSFISELTEQVDAQNDTIAEKEKHLEQEKENLKKEEVMFAENGMRISRLKEGGNSSKKKNRRRMSNAEALKYARVPETPIQTETKSKNAEKKTPSLKDLFIPGVEVYAGKERRQGTLVKKNKNGTWTVLFGSLKMNVPQTQLMPVSNNKIQVSSVVVEASVPSDGEDRPVFELRLLGMRQEDAMKALERQLDLCTIYNFREFSIIHGKGMGILQQSVQDYLSHYPGVKEFHFAPPEDGGTGKTYVSLF